MRIHGESLTMQQQYGFKSSVVQYPTRNSDGNNKYRGNTCGNIVRDFIQQYVKERTRVFFDPMEGSGTSGDAARAMGLRYKGFDLKDGFDAVRDDIRSALGEDAGGCFLHPAYAGMITYSGNMWGAAPHPSDLSMTGKDINAFKEMLEAVLQNSYRALAPNGVMGVLIGDWRKDGAYFDLASEIYPLIPGTQVDKILKIQSNCWSDAVQYSGTFVRIMHETLFVFKRRGDNSIFATTIDSLERLTKGHTTTWKNLIVGWARECKGTGKPFTTEELIANFENHPRAQNNAHLRQKMYQTVQFLQKENKLERVARGRYALAAA